jgi:hypothetical protein
VPRTRALPVLVLCLSFLIGAFPGPARASSGTLQGRVTDSAGMATSAACLHGRRSDTGQLVIEHHVLADGSYRDEIPPGDYDLRFDDCDSRPFVTGTLVHVTVRDGQVTNQDAALPAPGSLSGTLTDALGQPVSGLCVSTDGGDSGRTDAAGTYRLDPVRAGRYRVSFGRCDQPTWAPMDFGGGYDLTYPEADHTPVTVAPGQETSGIDAQPARYGSLTGRVTFPDGSPVSGPLVFLSHVQVNGRGATGVTQEIPTVVNGGYQFTKVPPGHYELSIKAVDRAPIALTYYSLSGRSSATTLTFTDGDNVTLIDVVTPPEGRIVGTVLNAAGQPLPGVSVAALPGRAGGHDYQPESNSTVTDASGHYVLGGFAKDSYTVQFTEPGFPAEYYGDTDLTHAPQVPVAPGQEVVIDHRMRHDTAPPTVAMRSAPAFTAMRSVGFGWAGSDAGGVASYDVRVRSARWNGAFGAFQLPASLQGTRVASAALGTSPGTVTCASVRAHDRVGNTSGWSGEVCTSALLDDRSLTAGAGWTRRTAKTAYAGTFTTTSSASRDLTLRGGQFDRLAVLVTTCPTCGRLAVYAGSRRVALLDLRSSASHTQVLKVLPALPRQTATLTLRSTSGLRVDVDAVGIGRSRVPR